MADQGNGRAFMGLIGLQEIAAHMRVSKPKVKEFISQGMPIQKEGRTIYAHPSNIDDWFRLWTKKQYKGAELPDDVE